MDAFTQGTISKVGLDTLFQQTVWDDDHEITERMNESGVFAALNGCEWTSTEDGNNPHGNVICREAWSKSPQSRLDLAGGVPFLQPFGLLVLLLGELVDIALLIAILLAETFPKEDIFGQPVAIVLAGFWSCWPATWPGWLRASLFC